MAVDRVLVAPFDEALLARLQPYAVMIRLRHQRDIARALECAARLHLRLHALWIDTPSALCAMDVRDEWSETPLVLFVSAAGSYGEMKPLIPLLERINARVYLPATTAENLLAARILASFGVRSAVVLEAPMWLWDDLSRLMIYALRGGGHAPVEPFHYIESHYRAGACIDFAPVYFEDPSRYLHLDRHGRVALTAGRAQRGEFIAESVDALSETDWPLAPAAPAAPDDAECACCDAWPVCLGRFASQAPADLGCRRFFTDMLDVLDGKPHQ